MIEETETITTDASEAVASSDAANVSDTAAVSSDDSDTAAPSAATDASDAVDTSIAAAAHGIIDELKTEIAKIKELELVAKTWLTEKLELLRKHL